MTAHPDSTPVSIEVLYFDGCPNHHAFLPHLHDLLREHRIAATVSLTRIETDAEALAHRFPGSPTVRVAGSDIDPAVAGWQRADLASAREPGSDDSSGASRRPYAMTCRLYPTSDGLPPDQWILDAIGGHRGAETPM